MECARGRFPVGVRRVTGTQESLLQEGISGTRQANFVTLGAACLPRRCINSILLKSLGYSPQGMLLAPVSPAFRRLEQCIPLVRITYRMRPCLRGRDGERVKRTREEAMSSNPGRTLKLFWECAFPPVSLSQGSALSLALHTQSKSLGTSSGLFPPWCH